MKIKLIIAFSIFVAISCNQINDKQNDMADKTKQQDDSTSSADLTPKVTGIGGIFSFSENLEETKEWYAKHLGLEVNQWGSCFEFRNADRPDELKLPAMEPLYTGKRILCSLEKRIHD